MFRSSLIRKCSSSGSTAAAAAVFTGAMLSAHKQSMMARLAAQQAHLASLEATKAGIDAQCFAKAKTFAYVGAAYLAAQTSTLFVWTYSTFDWNLVEPITFLLGYGLVWLSVLLYFCTGRDFTYAEVRSLVADRARNRLYEQKGFDVAEYQRVVAEVRDLEGAIKGLSVVKV